MTRVTGPLVLLLAMLALPDASAAQTLTDCELLYSPTVEANVVNQGSPNEVTYIGGGRVRIACNNGLHIDSDSVVHLRRANTYEFIGNVEYTDTARTLTSGYMNYMGNERRVFANLDVLVRDRQTGSTLETPQLDYFMQSALHPEDSIAARPVPGELPVARLVRVAADTTRRDTTVVEANIIDILGQSRLIARGNAVITRSDATAVAAEAEIMQDGGSLRLVNNARIVGEAYTMRGDSILGTSGEDGEFRELRAMGDAQIDGDEIDVDAPTVVVLLANRAVDRVVAIGVSAEEAEEEGVPLERAHATSTELRLEADSIDIRAPAQVVDSVTAVGNAFAERLTGEPTNTDRPALVRNDWVRGDVIMATFADAATEPARRVLEQLDIRGGEEQARSLYCVPDRDDPEAAPAISYIRAAHIVVHFRDGEVVTVQADDASGSVHGLYLRPTGGGEVESCQ